MSSHRNEPRSFRTFSSRSADGCSRSQRASPREPGAGQAPSTSELDWRARQTAPIQGKRGTVGRRPAARMPAGALQMGGRPTFSRAAPLQALPATKAVRLEAEKGRLRGISSPFKAAQLVSDRFNSIWQGHHSHAWCAKTARELCRGSTRHSAVTLFYTGNTANRPLAR